MTRDKLRTKSFDHTGRQWYYKTEVDKLLNDFESRTCEWKVDEDTIYSTSCHNMWEFTEGDLTDNEIKFCPYCGSKIVSTDTKGE